MSWLCRDDCSVWLHSGPIAPAAWGHETPTLTMTYSFSFLSQSSTQLISIFQTLRKRSANQPNLDQITSWSWPDQLVHFKQVKIPAKAAWYILHKMARTCIDRVYSMSYNNVELLMLIAWHMFQRCWLIFYKWFFSWRGYKKGYKKTDTIFIFIFSIFQYHILPFNMILQQQV